MDKQDIIGHALIKFSEAEIDLILTALYNTEKLSIPRVKTKRKRLKKKKRNSHEKPDNNKKEETSNGKTACR